MHLSLCLTHTVHVLCHSWFWWAAKEILKNMCRDNLIKCIFLYIYQPINKIIRTQGHRNILNPGNFISGTLKYQDWKYWMFGWMTVEISWGHSADRVLVPNQLYIPYKVPTLFFSRRLLPWYLREKLKTHNPHGQPLKSRSFGRLETKLTWRASLPNKLFSLFYVKWH